jgi:endo-1,4-beta-xylanase
MTRLVFGAAALALCAAAQEWVATPSGGESLFPEDSFAALRISGSTARAETIEIEGMPFRKAMRVTVPGIPRNPWDVQILGTTSGHVQQGDVLWLSLFARGSSETESGEASGIAHLQRNSGDFAKIASMPFSVGREWKQFMLPATATTTLPNGQHGYTIFLGFPQQTVEIGGVVLVNFRTALTTADLPRTKATWQGSEPDAPWRKIAAQRIDAIRKADLRVRVIDGTGRPLAGVTVRAKMTRHEFGFGSAVAADGIFSQAPDSHAYREVIRTWFNKVVLENDLKWPNWESNRNRALNALAWLRENGIHSIRGHTLVWPGWSRMPADVQRLSGDPERLRARVLDHIGEQLDATRGQLVEWDVLNEPYTNTDLQRILGEEEMAAWFRKARQHDPGALLYINDYSILTNGGTDAAHQNHYFETIGKLIDWGAPLDGIGMQGHFGTQFTAPERLWQILDRYAVYGKRIQVTEFDIDTEDEEAQAAYTRDFLTAVFAHPSIDGFMMWGFWEARHWRPRAAMFRRDWSIKPNGYAFYDLVHREWSTDETGVTNSEGEWVVRGFKGRYDIEVRAGSRGLSGWAVLTGGGTAVTVIVQ